MTATGQRAPRALRTRQYLRRAYGLLAPLSARFRARVQRRCLDRTRTLTSSPALVLAPHADDETLGCGVTVLRKREAGARVSLVVATDGSGSHSPAVIARDALAALRRREMLEAARLLGVPEGDVTFLDHRDGHLADARDDLAQRIAEIIRAVRPAEIFVTSVLDAHPDHQALALAARTAAVATGFEGRLYEYPVWYWERLPWIHRPRTLPAAAWCFLRDPWAELLRPPPHGVRTEGYLDRKRAALEAHASQVRPVPGGPATPHLAPDFVEHFFQRHEVFFPVRLRD